MAEEAAELAAAAAKRAGRYAMLCMLVAAIFIVLTVIDNGIKRAILAEAQGTRDAAAILRRSIVEARYGTSGEGPADSGPGDHGGDGVVHAAGASAAADGDAARPRARAARGSRGARGGAGGDGQRAGGADE